MFCGGNELFILLLLLCGCGGNRDNGGCGCGYDRRGNGDCCDLILWYILISCICGDKNRCCK